MDVEETFLFLSNRRKKLLLIYYIEITTFEILHNILQHFQGYWNSVEISFITKYHENRLIIDGEINEKHALLVSSVHQILTSKVVLGI